MHNLARIAAVAALATAPIAAASATALADDAHQTCATGNLICTGNILDVHDLFGGLPALSVPTVPTPSIPTLPAIGLP